LLLSLDQSIDYHHQTTGYEPGQRNLNPLIILYFFFFLPQSLTQPTSPTTVLKMATPIENSGKFYNAANYGPIEKLTMLNYFSWKQSLIFYLNSLRVLDIVDGTRPALPHNTSRERREALAKETALASSVIHGACSTGVHPHLTGLMDPHEIWLKLQTQFDSASSASARETILSI
jgi:hypothetical protein